ncbi:MAG: ABC transporter permease [Pseudomonadota bacterium]
MRRLTASPDALTLVWVRAPSILVTASIVLALIVLAAAFAPWLAPQDPFDAASLDLMDSFIPPSWATEGDPRFWLGSDDQGRDLASAILYGCRISLLVGGCAVLVSVLIGVPVGLLSGYAGGPLDAFLMRLADIQLTIPGLLIALLIGGIARAALPHDFQGAMSGVVLVMAIGIADWPQYARVVRSSTMVEKEKDYVAAAGLIGRGRVAILCYHILPNVCGPILVLASIGLAMAIMTEATLSFLGVGMPPTTPSLGTLIRVGQDFLFSGEWWISLFPALALVILVLCVNLVSDGLRDRFDPKLARG